MRGILATGARDESSLPDISLCSALDFHPHCMLIGRMNLFDLTSNQLKRAAAIKDQIEALNSQLRGMLGVSAKSAAVPKKRRTTRAAGKKSVAAKPKKKVFSAATRAKLSAKLKAYWAAKRAGKK